MAQLGEAIARYHKLLRQPRYRDLTWAEELQDQIRTRHLMDSGLVAPVLRPHFVSRRQLDTLIRVSEHLAAILDQIEGLALESPPLLNRLQMLPAEKMLAAIPSTYSRFSITSRIEAHLQNGSVCLGGFEACNPQGLGYSEPLADLFLNLPIVKEFKRGRYKLSKLGNGKHLLTALLQAWKEFGGLRQPNIAIVEIGDQFGSESSEGHLFAESFTQAGFTARVVSPDQMQYMGGKLHAGEFEIQLVFRRILTRELLVRFDLSHPLLQAYRDRAVCVVNDFRSEIAHRRALFDLVTDESVTGRLPFADRKLIRNFVPWTRVVSQRKTKYRDRDVDLPEFIRHTREQLMLRPNDDAGQQPIFVGAEMTPEAWERAIHLALRTPYVAQERLSGGRELFPLLQHGELQMREANVSVHPHVFNGRMHGASATLETSATGCASPLSIAPVLLLESN